LARQGILTRYFAAAPSVRFGLPAKAEDWQRLETALSISRDVQEIAEKARDEAKREARR
jgi:hypothetical protein